jgi:hypothetical protein
MQLVLFDAQLAVSRRKLIHCSAFAKRATVAKSHWIATALLQLISYQRPRLLTHFGIPKSGKF